MSGLLSHLVRRTLTPETAVRPLRQPRFIRGPVEALPAVEANRPARDERLEPANETRSTTGRRATPPPPGIEELDEAPRRPAAEPPPRPIADRPVAANPARPQPPAGPARSTTVVVETVEDGGRVVSAAPARERPHAPAAEPRLERTQPSRHLAAEADEDAEPIAADPPTAAGRARPAPAAARQVPARAAAEAPRDEAPSSRPAHPPLPVVRAASSVEAPPAAATSNRQAAASTTAEPESGPESSRPYAAPAPVRRPAPAEPAAPRPVLERSLPARRPEAHRPSIRTAREAKPMPPDVHITIGRVEIRAVAAASEPERQAKPAPRPVESLADYLARRDGQRR
jgi:hypothetical protein